MQRTWVNVCRFPWFPMWFFQPPLHLRCDLVALALAAMSLRHRAPTRHLNSPAGQQPELSTEGGGLENKQHRGKIQNYGKSTFWTFSLKKWRFGSNDFPFQLGDFLRFQSLIFRGASFKPNFTCLEKKTCQLVANVGIHFWKCFMVGIPIFPTEIFNDQKVISTFMDRTSLRSRSER